MAVTHVNAADITASTTSAVAFSTTLGTAASAGDIICVAVITSTTPAGTAPTIAVKDSVNNVNFTQAIQQQGGNGSSKWTTHFLYQTPVALASGTSITCTPSGSAGATNFSADVFNGAINTYNKTPVGASVGAALSFTGPALASAPTAGSLVIVAAGGSAANYSASAPFTNGSHIAVSGGSAVAYALSADGSSTYAASWTIDSSQVSSAIVYALNQVTAASPAVFIAPSTLTRPGAGPVVWIAPVVDAIPVFVTVAATESLGTGTAYDAAVNIQPNATSAAGSGVANDAGAAIAVNANAATVTGTAYDATISAATSVLQVAIVSSQRHPGRGPSTFRFVQRAPAFSIGETDAGSGLATGIAYDAQVLVTSNAISAISTGAANDAAANVQPNAGSTGTGTAFNGGITIAGTAESASGSGTVNAGAANVQPNAAAGSGTGTAYDATVLTQVNPAIGFAQNARHPGRGPSTFRFVQRAPAFSLGETDATPGLSIGTAYDAQILVTCNATVASGTGSANDATANVRPNAGSTGTGTAFNGGITIVGNATSATGSGAVGAGVANVMPNVSEGLATGTAYDAGVVVVPQVGSRSSQRHPGKGPSTFRFVQRAPAFSIGEIDAGTAASTGTAYDAAIQIQANPGSGAGVGSAQDATTKVTCGASAGTATGAAQNPTPALGTVTAAALATAAANQAVAALRVNPATGTVTGTAYLASNGFKLLVDAQPALGAALPDDLWTAKPRIGSTAGANPAVTARPFTGVTFDPG